MPKRRGKKRGGRSKGKGRSTRRSVPSIIMPPFVRRKMPVITSAVISAASPNVIKRWNPNSAYTPETGGGSGITPGYADLAALYGYYRVYKYNYHVTISNNEAFPVVVFVINSNNDPTTSNSSTLSSNPKCQTFELSAKGGQDRCSFKRSYTIQYIVGSPSVKFDDLYSALITASPADITWLGIGAQSFGGTNLTLGVSAEMRLTLYVQFYDYLLQVYREHSKLLGPSTAMPEGVQPYRHIPATKEKEISDKKRAFASYQVMKSYPVPLNVQSKYYSQTPGYIPFEVTY